MPTAPRFTMTDFRRLSTGAVACTVHDSTLHRQQGVILHGENGPMGWDSPYLPKREAKKLERILLAFLRSGLPSLA